MFKAWRHVQAPTRGIVVLVHGLNGSVDDFEPLVESLAPAGYEFFAAGLRSQGEDPDPGKRGDLRNWRQLRDDLADFRRYVGQQTGKQYPVFVFAESMGALVALQAAGEADFAGVILSAPIVKFRHDARIPSWTRMLAQVLFRCAPWYRLDLKKLRGHGATDPVVTRDQAYCEKIRSAPYRIARFTLGFYRELIRLVLATPAATARLRAPTLVLAAGQDAFVSADDVSRFFDALPAPDKTLRVFPSSYHLLVRDFDAEQVIKDVRAWLDARASSTYGAAWS